MKADDEYKQELLKTWEETYKKGQLTFWILLSLREEARYVNDIMEFIASMTRGSITCEEQSLYRALRKFHALEMVDFELRDGNKGPDRKYYFLTSLGAEILEKFIRRNILILFNENLEHKLFPGGKSR